MKNTATDALKYMKLKTETWQDLENWRLYRKILPNSTQRKAQHAKY